MELVLCAPTSSDAAVWPTRTFPVLRAAGAATSASTAVPSSGCGGAASVSPEQGSPRTPEMHAAESRRGADSDSRSGCRLSTEALSHRSPHATESPKGTHSWHASSPQQQLALQALQQLSALVPSPSTRAPYESIIVDYLGPLQEVKGFKFVLIVKDRFSHEVHLEAV
eukprot:m51a1_g10339 hypothetical protein (168) ;mRNA; r:126029-134637